MKKLLLAFLLLSACHSENKEMSRPADLIPLEKMIPLLADLHLASAEVKMQQLPLDSSKTRIAYYRAHLFHQYNTTKEWFDASLKFYSDNPVQLDSIYEEVLTELSKRQAQEKPQAPLHLHF